MTGPAIFEVCDFGDRIEAWTHDERMVALAIRSSRGWSVWDRVGVSVPKHTGLRKRDAKDAVRQYAAEHLAGAP